MANGRHDPGAPPADVQVGTAGVGWVSHQFCNNKGDKVDRVAIPKSYCRCRGHTVDEGFFRPSFLLSFPPAVATIRKEQEKKLFSRGCHLGIRVSR